MQASPVRLQDAEVGQATQRKLGEAQAQLQASQEGAAAATRAKEAAMERCAELEQELSNMKV